MPKSAAKVVVIDDSPLILDLLRKSMEAYAEVSAYKDATDALLDCSANPPDLLICDYRMPGLDGSQLVHTLKARVHTQGVRVIMLATKPDIDEKLRPLADLVEEFVSKPFYIKELVSQAKKVLDRIYLEKMQKQAPKEGVMTGRLTEMNLIDLLQSLEMGQKTCSLTVSRDAESCRMFFSEGQLSHAELGLLVGDDAVYRVVAWKDGTFQIDFNARSDKRTTTQSTQGLLMEALRLLDEANRDSEG